MRDNGTGCDHGSGGVAFVLGGSVEGGLYGQYPSLRDADLSEGDMAYTTDFRTTYATVLDRWLGPGPGPNSPRPVRAVRVYYPLNRLFHLREQRNRRGLEQPSAVSALMVLVYRGYLPAGTAKGREPGRRS